MRPASGSDGVRFAVSMPEARTVSVAGAFNEWSATAHPMVHDGSTGLWRTSVPLESGEHAFMYVVDGDRWVTPPEADDFVSDGFGQTNGVVVVP